MKGSKIVDTIWFTEKNRKDKFPDTFGVDTKKYFTCDPNTNEFILKDLDKYSIELVPHNRVTEKYPQYVNYYLAQPNSGKSFQIAQQIKRYLEVFPKNTVLYASANPLSNDESYDGIRDKITEIDLMKQDGIIDFNEFQDTCFIFDDCDSLFSMSMEDLDERLDAETVKELSVLERDKTRKMLMKKMETLPFLINESIRSLIGNGRKKNISLCVVGHKYNDGANQMKILSGSTGVILFPYSTSKNVFQTFLQMKLGFQKEDAEYIANVDFYQYDFLFINNRGKRFIITPDRLKMFK